MKIIIINSSPRTNGATAQILHEIENKLKSKKADVAFYNLSQLEISHCKGCCNCYKTGKCFMTDDAEKLSQEIEHADGLVIGSPTYASNVSGLLKQFIDRGHFVMEQTLFGKYSISVSTFQNHGGYSCSKIINNLLSYSGALISKKIVVKTPFGKNINNKTKLIANQSAEKLYSDILHRKKYPIQSLLNKIIFEIGIKPFVKRNSKAYSAVISKYTIFKK